MFSLQSVDSLLSMQHIRIMVIQNFSTIPDFKSSEIPGLTSEYDQLLG